ncbi:FAD-dependent monooxygenase [Hydrogenophaga intermedia]|jgi:2-polyprenyl-6-methoxyphenol hydroxylase-like FAD-dependent oxidoreductase|uniref:FAD-dependent monooxygenase n=1 Tax=Hydrogenophaga intermedia TaxID=65786 RepID=UPI002043E12E|nr:FAD-dependent monooxygenase [Hydrogenophaga intermedia]MCM3562522.1 FAD-dependent monooxygenase [Hydrogenophaga intermedia]
MSSPATAQRADVVIRGAGVVGQALALLLAQDRLRVALVAPPAAPRADDVRAYALNNTSRELLRALRAWPDDVPGAVTPVTGMQVHGDADGTLRFDAAELGAEALTWIVDVPTLERRLGDAIGFAAGVQRVEEAPAARLTVVCEGRHSATREALGIEHTVFPYPHKAVAARLRAAQPHGGIARQWFADGEVLALLPLGGANAHELALVWSLPTDQAAQWLQAEPAALAAAVQARSMQALGELTLLGAPQAWPLQLSRARRWISRTAAGTVVLAGDAAHAVHPLAGQGLNLGLADAAELARVLHAREYWRELDDPKLLRRYERARAADVQAMAWVTDGLFSLFGLADSRVQLLRNRGLSGFDRSGPLKRWFARQAMGLSL